VQANLLKTIISLQPKVVDEGAESNESRILRLASSMAEQVPVVFDAQQIRTNMEARADPDPIKTVLFQETDRYNVLLAELHSSLENLQKGVQGLVVITPALEEIMEALLAAMVPDKWSFCFPSMKALGAWMRDLGYRCEQLTDWAEKAMPKVFWLSGFTYPTGFLTALLQTTARKSGTAIDSLSWDFPVLNEDEGSIAQSAKEGAYIKGIFVEGARWDFDKQHLAEPLPMELFCAMPLIHFNPVENKKVKTKGMYTCPIYMYPVRTGTRERPSFMIAADIKSGLQDSDFWTKRGTAMLLSLAE
jgi:dynein heavy chain